MKNTEQKVLKFINEKNLIQKGDKVLVALSGGPDSVFLLHFLTKFRSKLEIKIGSILVNHMIRGKAAYEDEVFCTNLCLYLGIELHIIRKNVKRFAEKNKISVEEAGRIIRYREFNKECVNSGYNKIATAHNCNDNAETMLLNFIKGTGIKGMSGIPVKRGIIIRPVLNIKKDEILDYLKENNIPYRTDLSNLSNEYERNFIRNKIIPEIKENLNPNLENILINASEIFSDSWLLLDGMFDKIKNKVISVHKDEVRLSLTGLEKTDRAIITSGLKSFIERNFGTQVEFDDIKKIFALKEKQAGRVAELSNKISAIRERNEIILRKRKDNQIEESVWLKPGETVEAAGKKLEIKKIHGSFPGYSGSRTKEYISADNIEKNFLLRKWKSGEKFFPIGFKGSKKISDFLNEQKIPSSKKKEQLVLINNNKIVWVVGLRLDERFKITNQTKKVFELCLK